jgi:hypothetical protein
MASPFPIVGEAKIHPTEEEKEITNIQKVIARMEGSDVKNLLADILSYSGRASKYAQTTIDASRLALLCAWTCGKLINAAKKTLGRGGFGAWRDEHLTKSGLSTRTSQRYMKLAESYRDVDSLLGDGLGLRKSYIACGILPEPEKPDTKPVTEEAPKTAALLKSLTGLQKRLRQLTQSKVELQKPQITQLKLLRNELDRIFNQLIPSGK